MARQSVKVFVHQRTSEMCEKFWTLSPETRVNIRTVGARKPPMMTGFQAEENLTGRAQKNVRKILDVISTPFRINPSCGMTVQLPAQTVTRNQKYLTLFWFNHAPGLFLREFFSVRRLLCSPPVQRGWCGSGLRSLLPSGFDTRDKHSSLPRRPLGTRNVLAVHRR